MGRKLRMAIIGCGHWGNNYVRLLSQLANVEILAICDTSEQRRQDGAARYPDLAWISGVDHLIEMYAIDAAVVCTSASSHYPVVRKLLEAGKHVLVEKPMTTDSNEAEELIALAVDRDVVLMVGHIFLYNSGIEKVRECIRVGQLGQIHYLYSRRTNLGPVRRDVNVLWDLASHDVSIFNYFLDSCPEWVSAVGASFLQDGIKDVGLLSLAYPDGVIGHIHVSWADPHKVREVVVVGSEQRIVFDDTSPQLKVVIYKKGIAASSLGNLGYNGTYQIAVRDGDIVSPSLVFDEPLKKQVLHFIECVYRGTRPLTDGLNGLEVVRTIEAANLSIKQNGMPVPIHGC